MVNTVASLLSHSARSAQSSAIRDLLRHAERPGVLSLAGGLPASARFPVAKIATAAEAVLGRGEGLQYGLTEGDPLLREWIAERHTRQGSATEAADIVVTTGSQQALDLLARVLVDPGDPIVVGDPCYVGARQALSSAQPEFIGIPVDDDGLDVDSLAQKLDQGLRPKLAYVVPNFDNPSGAVLTAPRRARMAELAEQYGFLIVEDDPYGALRYDGEPMVEIGSGSDWIVRLRTFSKTLAPGLRVGWLVGPQRVIEAVAIAKQAVDLHTSTVSQAIVREVVTTGGWFDDHIESLRPWYRNQRDALVTALQESLPGAGFVRPSGGMFCWLRIDGVDTGAMLPAALEEGVAFVPGSAFAIQRDLTDHLRLSFATVGSEELPEAVRRLSVVVP